MPVNLRHRSFLKGFDFSPGEWRFLLTLAADLKRAKYARNEVARLRGRKIALVSGRSSTRRRSASEVAAHDQGAHVTHLGSADLRLGHAEAVKDAAKVLGRVYDAIECQDVAQRRAETLARFSGVPVWNALSDHWHPTQALGDMLTVREHAPKRYEEVALAYCGDARTSLGNSVLVAGVMLGMDVRMVAPKERRTREDVITGARRIAEVTGARIKQTEDVGAGVRGVDFLYADVWLGATHPIRTWNERVARLAPYRITMDVIRATGNPDVKVMHRLSPAHHRRTAFGRKVLERTGVEALEITDEVFESPYMVAFDQAENGVHAIKAVMVATIGD